jgi:trehalose synthase
LIDRYRPLIGPRATDRVLKKARKLGGLRVLHVNSTHQGGGVAEILSRLTPLMKEVGIATDWLVIDGSPTFFEFTKEIHNALHGEPIRIAPGNMALHREVCHDNARRGRLDDYDVIIVHDPQPLWLVEKRRRQTWVWCCHIDLSSPHPDVWRYLSPAVNRYDAAVFSLPDYAQPLGVTQQFIMPAIDPFSAINHDMSRAESAEHLQRYGIPTHLPLVVQAGRFDEWKDPHGVIEAFCMATEHTPAMLVLVGNTAADDPEGPEMLESVCAETNEQIKVIAADDPLLVNALQRRAAVVLQKSLREGFGLTVSEAMWKGRPVIGGDVGGIRAQIVHGYSGFLVADVSQTAGHIATLLRDPSLRHSMGRRAKARVRDRFLMSRLLEEWLDLIAGLARSTRIRSAGTSAIGAALGAREPS